MTPRFIQEAGTGNSPTDNDEIPLLIQAGPDLIPPSHIP